MSQEKVVGKPYEGEPHVRIEVAGNGDQDTDGLVRHSQRKRGATDRSNLRPRRHSLTLPATGMRPTAARFKGGENDICFADGVKVDLAARSMLWYSSR